MSDPKPKEPPESRTEGSRVGGNVKIEGPGTFVGRDQYVGLKVEELVAALRQAFPSGDTRPERWSQLLDEFRAYHAKLYEWKELHNALNKIIDAFDQYAGRVESSYIEKNPLKPSLYRDAWRPVNRNVDDMLDWAQTIQYIGQRYQALANDRLEGERWAVDVKARRDDLVAHFQRGQAIEQSTNLQRLFQPNSAQEWLRQLYDLTHEFEDAIKRYMSQADTQLRETASNLYGLSKQAFGN